MCEALYFPILKKKGKKTFITPTEASFPVEIPT
jgi:hypothetical protein